MSGIDARHLVSASAMFSLEVQQAIHRAAETGTVAIQGLGVSRPVPHFDELVFLGAGLVRRPVEACGEGCKTNVTLGTRHAQRPIQLARPITLAGMSYGAVGYNAKQTLCLAAARSGTSLTTGEGGITDLERQSNGAIIYQLTPGRSGLHPDDLCHAAALEIVVSQGARPGGGGLLPAAKVNERVSQQRRLPPNTAMYSAARHPDWLDADELSLKIRELRELTDWQIPILVKLGATRVAEDVTLAVKAGADVIVLDGMQAGTGSSPSVFVEHVGIPTVAAIRQAVEALQALGLHREVQLVVSGGIRNGADAAKALALGADAVSIGTAALMAIGCNRPIYNFDYHKLGTEAGACHHCHTGRCPVGITTHDVQLEARLDVEAEAEHLQNFLQVMTLEIQALAEACGKRHVLHLEPEDLVALSVEAAAMAKVPLAGTHWIPGV